MKKKIDFTKKDLLLLLILSVTIFFCNYFLSWHSVYKEYNLNVSILSDYLVEVSNNEFDSYITENPNSFVYLGVVDDLETRNFEKEFKATINRYFLNDKVIYINIKDIDINELLKPYNDIKQIEKTPVIIYFEEGKVLDFINTSNHSMKSDAIIRFFKHYGDI
ncbi:MAG: hypothetical protein PHR55_02770 [Bacilli bacterium]|nr:hypothetical protein [Bacilli bacterium]MDD4832031.1 hypothetical protein [Bacilli bacterium]